MTGDGSGAAGSGAAESRAAGARGEGVGAGAGIGAGAGAANATANNPASNSCARNNTLEISTIRSLLLSYGNLALTVFNMLVFRQRTTSCTTTMGRLHADRRGDAAYIGRETRDQRSPIFLLHPLLSYIQREGQQQQVPPCWDLLLLLLLLGGSNLFSTRSTNPLLLLFSFATISQRLTTGAWSPSQGWERPNNTRHFLLFHGGCVPATSPSPHSRRNANRFSPFEPRRPSKNDLRSKYRSTTRQQTKSTRNWVSIEIIQRPDRLSTYRVICVFDFHFSWTKVEEGSWRKGYQNSCSSSQKMELEWETFEY